MMTIAPSSLAAAALIAYWGASVGMLMPARQTPPGRPKARIQWNMAETTNMAPTARKSPRRATPPTGQLLPHRSE
jgi:hypothetical protein